MIIKTAILGYGRSGSTLHADPLEKLSDDFTVSALNLTKVFDAIRTSNETNQVVTNL